MSCSPNEFTKNQFRIITNFLTSQIESGLFIRKTTTLNKQFDWLKTIREQLLTPNTPLIHTWFTYSIWNMGEICGLKFHLIYVHTSQKILLKSLHAQNVSFLLLNLHF